MLKNNKMLMKSNKNNGGIRMKKWIKLNNGTLVNLDRVCYIEKDKVPKFEKIVYQIIFDYGSVSTSYVEEDFSNEKERDSRFDEIEAMLIEIL